LSSKPITFYKKKPTEAQAERFQNHAASVRVRDDGEIEILEEDIVNPNGVSKKNKLISVLPTQEEKIETFNRATEFFQELGHLNIILTNACNLSCTYCYEQHNKDYGRFTVESLRKSFDWLLNINDMSPKTFQFFGGEPLIHKKLIIDFINSDPSYFQEVYDSTQQQISICTNGLLLDPEFIGKYFSLPYTNMLLSLDTIRADIDHRQIEQPDLDKLLGYIEAIPTNVKSDRRLVIRCTLSEETAPYMNEFIDAMYTRGVRQLIVHPLILDSSKGFISWKPENWSRLHQDILDNLEKHFDLQIQFVEGVGKKHESNCMVGADMIAIDASGDFSGCYFFTNQKTNGTGHTILGNVFKDQVYVDRYATFQKMYNEMFESEEQCQTCNYRDACYQCPAGNADTGGRLFRPDDMCQKIVKLYIDLKDDVSKKNFLRDYQRNLKEAETVGFDQYLSSGIAMLGLLYFGGLNQPLNSFFDKDLPNYKRLAYWFQQSLHNRMTPDSLDAIINAVDENQLEIVDLYKMFMQEHGVPVQLLPTSGVKEDLFYLHTIGQLVINSRLKMSTKGMLLKQG
jgi:radical SAM protein with 4Fe4S-binding SPASM domain